MQRTLHALQYIHMCDEETKMSNYAKSNAFELKGSFVLEVALQNVCWLVHYTGVFIGLLSLKTLMPTINS